MSRRSGLGISALAFRVVAENRLREAEAAGLLDCPPCPGPLPGMDEPYHEDWWLRAWLRRERAQERSAGSPDQRSR